MHSDVVYGYIAHAERQIEQIRRRVIAGETIPHHEKVFSIFEGGDFLGLRVLFHHFPGTTDCAPVPIILSNKKSLIKKGSIQIKRFL